MKKIVFFHKNKIRFFWLTGLTFLIVFFPFSQNAGQNQEQEYQIEKAKIYQDVYPLISEADMYCSFRIWEGKLPELRIIGGEREYERVLYNNDDVIYLNQGMKDGLQAGQVFLIVEIGPQIDGFGSLALKRGRARVYYLSEEHASAKVEKACGQVMIGHYLIPFEETEGLLGKDEGFKVPPYEIKGPQGRIIYLQTQFNQIGSGHWALIDLGKEHGFKTGDQLIVYREVVEGAPLHILGNVLIIDAQDRTSTIKVLSSRDAIRLGDCVQRHPNQVDSGN